MFIPMAISLAFGVIFATVITMFLVPSLYLMLQDWLEFCGLDKARDHSQSPTRGVEGDAAGVERVPTLTQPGGGG